MSEREERDSVCESEWVSGKEVKREIERERWRERERVEE